MAHIEDRWFKTIEGPDGKPAREKSNLYGKGRRYRVRYIAPDGRERSKSFPDRQKKEAEAFLISIESDKLKGSYIDPAAGRVDFEKYAEQWLRTHAVDESSRESMELKLRKHVFPYFRGRQLGSIKPSDIREWDNAQSRKLAVSTRSVVFAYLRSIFSAAVDDERIAKNPCSARSVKQPRPSHRKVVPWSIEQVQLIRNGLAVRYRLAVDLAAGCGMRQGEVFGMGADDFDLDEGFIYVRRQIKIVRHRLVFGLPKNDKERSVPLPESVAKMIKNHVETVSPVKITLPWEDPTSDERVTVPLILTTTRRGGLKRNDFNELMWHPALRKAGITPDQTTGMHALRHFYASTLLDAGESIKALAEYLGHSDPAFTLRLYTHLMPSSEARTRKAIDDVFKTAYGLETA